MGGNGQKDLGEKKKAGVEAPCAEVKKEQTKSRKDVSATGV